MEDNMNDEKLLAERKALFLQKQVDAKNKKKLVKEIRSETAKAYESLLEPLKHLGKDLRSAASLMGRNEVRFLVDAYYSLQKTRIAIESQNKQLILSKEPNSLSSWLSIQMNFLEDQLKPAMKAWVENQVVGQWLLSITGIGPVLSGGLLAHIDLTPWRCRNKTAKITCKEATPCSPACGREVIHTAGHIWSFAGIWGHQEWKEGEKRPWNAQLKELCYKVGESFVMVQNNKNDYYGKVFAERKRLEEQRNEAGILASQAEDKLKKFKIGKTTEAYRHYSKGKLPPAHIHARARRYAVKLFLAHLHHVMYECKFNAKPPKPYIIEHGGHTHFIAPPNWPFTQSASAAD